MLKNGGFQYLTLFSWGKCFLHRTASNAPNVPKGKTMQLYTETQASGGLPLPAPEATGDELFRLGLLYSTGQGGAPLDYVSAHMLFNLAAMRGSEEGKIYRRELSREMDQAEVADAQRAARQWLAQG
jgi:TPR repeat protein